MNEDDNEWNDAILSTSRTVVSDDKHGRSYVIGVWRRIPKHLSFNAVNEFSNIINTLDVSSGHTKQQQDGDKVVRKEEG